MVQITSLFHLNIHFSSLPIKDRLKVIQSCYHPLLLLAEEHNFKISIESSASGLEVMESLDPSIITKIAKLWRENKIEFIGCGYVQAIGPLMPEEMVYKNLHIGQEIYQKLLGRKPDLALINEQTWSGSLIKPYLAAGFKGLIMDRSVVQSAHPSWDQAIFKKPIYAKADDDSAFDDQAIIPILWCDTWFFQQFQRYAHGDYSFDRYLDFLKPHLMAEYKEDMHLPLYGSDAEIFGYRPQRYDYELAPSHDVEWQRIITLYLYLKAQSQLSFIFYQDLLEKLEPNAMPLRLETAAQPILIKKQKKYNIVRWAVSGRDDLRLNLYCFRLYHAIKQQESLGVAIADQDWIDLLALWRSDLRTHIEANRWMETANSIDYFNQKYQILPEKQAVHSQESFSKTHQALRQAHQQFGDFQVTQDDFFLNISWQYGALRLKKRRGLAIDSFSNHPAFMEDWLAGGYQGRWIGTLSHGHFQDINYGADYYSGHLTFEPPGQGKITDLSPVSISIGLSGEDKKELSIITPIATRYGTFIKELIIDPLDTKITWLWHGNFLLNQLGSLRFGYITLCLNEAIPSQIQGIKGVFDPKTLTYAYDGNPSFSIAEEEADFDHGAGVSHIVSANQAVPMVKGQIIIEDKLGHRLTLESVPSNAPLLGMFQKIKIGDKSLIRCCFSASEMDDTRKIDPNHHLSLPEPLLKQSLTLTQIT